MNQHEPVKKKPKISLRVKIFVALLIVSVIPLTVALLFAYAEGTAIHRYYVRSRFQSLSQWMSDEIKASFSSEISDAQSLALAPTLLSEVARANESYKGRSQEAALSEIMRIDEEWRTVPKINDTIRKYLGNSVSQYLQNIVKLRPSKFAEIFVTDELGALVGATGKTTDFYQADEDWWIKAFNRGNGRNIIQGIELDESTQFPSLTVAVPVIDPVSNTVMGVLKVVLKAELFFHPVNTLRMEQSGYAGITTTDGLLLATSSPTRTSRLSANFWQAIAGRSSGWTNVVDEKGEQNVLGFTAIDTNGIDGEAYLTGGRWYVFFYQPVREGYELISAALYRVLVLGLGLVAIASLLGFYATNWIVMPIRLLREEAQYIARGDLGRRVEVHTNDEIESLAEEINVMSQKLKETHANLEQRIEERTTELSEANKKLEAQREVLLKVNKQLMKASTLKSQFLAEICDGLSNPVLNIVQLSEVVLEQGAGHMDETQKDYLIDILSNAKHLHQLINEVFTLAKATSGKIELNLSEVSVGQILHEVHETVRALAAEKNVKFEFQIDDAADKLTADANLFKHIIFNLYTNSIKYSKINGKVTVSTARVDDSVEISVADKGIGIRPEDQERIFHEFEKVEDGQEPYYEGAGMGLALVQRFVEMHGGKIWVESEYGKGSTFIFRIPLTSQ